MSSKNVLPDVPTEVLTILSVVQGEYVILQDILKQLEAQERRIKDSMSLCAPSLGEYGPFRFASDFKFKLRTARIELIQKCAEALRMHVCPMAKLEQFDFVKMMNEAVGNDMDFSIDNLEGFFDKLEADHATVQKHSLNTIMQRAHHFLPYSNAGGGWGPTKNAEDLIESGNALVLKCYSWSVDRINWNLNSDHELNALHKAIEIALFDMDPAKTERYRQLVDHVNKNRESPATFYLTVAVEHPAISRFRFYKNDTLKIWFKNRDYALRAAKFLIGGQPQ